MTAGEVLEQHLSEAEQKSLSQKLIEAETGTYGEIIPLVALSSHDWRTLPVIVDLLVFSFLMSVCCVFQLPWMWWLGSFFLGLMAGALVPSFPELIPWLTSKSERSQAARQRAELEFYRQHFDRSQKHATVLLFVSILERQVVVLVEPELSKKIPPLELDSTIQQITSALTQELRKKDWHQGFANAIQMSGEMLKKYAPAGSDYRHEYPARIFLVGE